MVIEAFFRSAIDARYAIGALRRAGVEPSDPIPLDEPNNTRPWRVDITVGTGSLSERYPQSVLANEVYGIVRKHNGSTEQVSRV